MSLSGKRAVVTGSTRGIGFAVARSLVREGAGVMVTSRNGAAIEEAVSSLRGLGTGPVLGQVCDVRDPEQVRALVGSCVAQLGRIENGTCSLGKVASMDRRNFLAASGGLLNAFSVAGRLCGCPTTLQNRYSRKSTRGCQEISSVH